MGSDRGRVLFTTHSVAGSPRRRARRSTRSITHPSGKSSRSGAAARPGEPEPAICLGLGVCRPARAAGQLQRRRVHAAAVRPAGCAVQRHGAGEHRGGGAGALPVRPVRRGHRHRRGLRPRAGNASSFGWGYLHQGGRLDTTSGWYLFRNRDYIANEGRWAERDPLGLAAGDNNIYRYVGNSPTNGLDPLGLWDLARWFWTSDRNASDEAYSAAMGAAGESVLGNSDRAKTAFDTISYVDPTPISDTLSAGMSYAQGNDTQARQELAMAAIPGAAGQAGKHLGKLRALGKYGDDAAELAAQRRLVEMTGDTASINGTGGSHYLARHSPMVPDQGCAIGPQRVSIHGQGKRSLARTASQFLWIRRNSNPTEICRRPLRRRNDRLPPASLGVVFPRRAPRSRSTCCAASDSASSVL